MYLFKSAILRDLKNCKNGTFEPVHEIQKLFWWKDHFLKHYEVDILQKKNLTCPRVCQIQDLGQSE
jgi:hypothetical protein